MKQGSEDSKVTDLWCDARALDFKQQIIRTSDHNVRIEVDLKNKNRTDKNRTVEKSSTNK